jgi:hypothetical protein
MNPHQDHPASGEPIPILDRTDTGGGWSKAWPLIALALIGIMLVHSCVTSPSASDRPPPASTPTSR